MGVRGLTKYVFSSTGCHTVTTLHALLQSLRTKQRDSSTSPFFLPIDFGVFFEVPVEEDDLPTLGVTFDLFGFEDITFRRLSLLSSLAPDLVPVIFVDGAAPLFELSPLRSLAEQQANKLNQTLDRRRDNGEQQIRFFERLKSSHAVDLPLSLTDLQPSLLPFSQHHLFSAAIVNAAARAKTPLLFCWGEGDLAIARFCHQLGDRVVAVMSSDSDFLVNPAIPLVLFHTFPKSLDDSLQLFSPRLLADHLHLPLTSLPLFGALLGNDYTSTLVFAPPPPSSAKHKKRKAKGVKKVSGRIARVASVLRSILSVHSTTDDQQITHTHTALLSRDLSLSHTTVRFCIQTADHSAAANHSPLTEREHSQLLSFFPDLPLLSPPLACLAEQFRSPADLSESAFLNRLVRHPRIFLLDSILLDGCLQPFSNLEDNEQFNSDHSLFQSLTARLLAALSFLLCRRSAPVPAPSQRFMVMQRRTGVLRCLSFDLLLLPDPDLRQLSQTQPNPAVPLQSQSSIVCLLHPRMKGRKERDLGSPIEITVPFLPTFWAQSSWQIPETPTFQLPLAKLLFLAQLLDLPDDELVGLVSIFRDFSLHQILISPPNLNQLPPSLAWIAGALTDLKQRGSDFLFSQPIVDPKLRADQTAGLQGHCSPFGFVALHLLRRILERQTGQTDSYPPPLTDVECRAFVYTLLLVDHLPRTPAVHLDGNRHRDRLTLGNCHDWARAFALANHFLAVWMLLEAFDELACCPLASQQPLSSRRLSFSGPSFFHFLAILSSSMETIATP